MKTPTIPIWPVCMAALLVTTSTSHAQSSAADAFDGRWTTTLICDDTHDQDKLVKGYEYVFNVDVVHGRLEGQYGPVDGPASVKYLGVIHADGSAEIAATGRTGKNEYTMGKGERGTAYGYRLRGQFDATSGHATRMQIRPCEATFAKQ